MAIRATLFSIPAIFLAAGVALASGPGAHWTYEGHEGPEHWGELSADFAVCKSGRMQSPVDLATANQDGTVNVTGNYMPTPLIILNNGHTVQVNVDNGNATTVNGAPFKLIQFHFHTPSEHIDGGKAHAMEVHFVHKSEGGNLAVIGVFFDEGAENKGIAEVVKYAPAQKAEPAAIKDVSVDPTSILPKGAKFYRYMGSLTTPPCSEGVNWFVADKVVTASKAQIEAMHKVMGENARPPQPLNNRLLIHPQR